MPEADRNAASPPDPVVRACLVGIIARGAQFTGDGRNSPRVVIKLGGRSRPLAPWLLSAVPSRLNGPYKSGTREYVLWTVTGGALRDVLIPALADLESVNPEAAERMRAWQEQYGL